LLKSATPMKMSKEIWPGSKKNLNNLLPLVTTACLF
jgi:hypothetical protein